jgi:DNA mismatch repair protein MutS
MAGVTPLMQQYQNIKAKHPDALLLFRVGDFYETFGKDAIKTSQILDIVLTKRSNGSASDIELAGFPHHALDTYLPKLVRAGQRVAICDQLEDPKQTKTIVKRGVTELVTPGVTLNDQILRSKSNNFLAAIHFDKDNLGIAFVDVSTGEFLTAQGNQEYIDKLIQSLNPTEILFSKKYKQQINDWIGSRCYYFAMDDWAFQFDFAYESLTNHFKTSTLKGFGIEDIRSGITASGAILRYLSDTQHNKLEHIASISRITEDDYVWMDRFTIRNLELFQSNAPDGVSLLDVVDKTITPMGGRMLKRWLALPLKDKKKIEERHDLVAYFKSKNNLTEAIIDQLSLVHDIERLVSKIATGKINPREVLALKSSLEAIHRLKENLAKSKENSLIKLEGSLEPTASLEQLIVKYISEEAPIAIAKGGVINKGLNEELDDLRNLLTNGKEHLEQIQQREAERTSISSLKLAFNNVFGYYLEVRNTHKDKVPAEWVRKQTLVNAERYITEELKTYETKILGAEERILKLETEIYSEFIGQLQRYISILQYNAKVIANIDCLVNFAIIARQYKYFRPEFTDEDIISITGGRHPVIEQQLSPDNPYVESDTNLNKENQQIIMITGPNMSGKSALLRQTALLCLLAQIGSFVPAKSLKLKLLDKIFVRVGASDNISQGESTFMVEMNETASILNNLSPQSLILLDEIGRGTSTYDGISIAWAITNFLHEHPSKPLTLFATHYHELNEMTHEFPRIKNFNVSIKEVEGRIIFMRKLVAGGSAHSFGIHVAEMAGMPKFVTHKAHAMLQKLEALRENDDTSKALKKDALQLSFFQLDDPLLENIKNDLAGIDINTLTPVEALMLLNEWKQKLGIN